MKYLLHIIVLLSLFAVLACDPAEKQPLQKDSISLSSKGRVTDYQQQTMSITVTSSGGWTLTGSYDSPVLYFNEERQEIENMFYVLYDLYPL
jgi:hypothetical protein